MGYTSIMLDKPSKKKLINRFVHLIPPDWEIIGPLHMTINMGPITKGPADPELLDQEVTLTVVSVAADEKVIAVGVTSDVPSKNAQKHITLAVNRDAGGKPFLSNKLTNWEELPEQMELYGAIQQIG